MIERKFICIKDYFDDPICLLFKGYIYDEIYLSKYYLTYSLNNEKIIMSIDKYRESRINEILND